TSALSRRFRCGSRESSPDDPAGPETPAVHPPAAAPDRLCDISVLLPHSQTGPAQSASPSTPAVHDSHVPVPHRRCRALPLLRSALAVTLHPARTVACWQSARPATPDHPSPSTLPLRTRSSSLSVHTCSTPTCPVAATHSLTRAATPRHHTGSLTHCSLPSRLPPAAATLPASLAWS